MSIELLLTNLTEAVKELTTVMRSGNTASAEVTGKSEPEKTDAKVRYFHIPKHNTVAEVKPGDVVPTIESTVEIKKAEYDKLKKQYAEPKTDAVPFAKLTERATALSKIMPNGGEELRALLKKHLPGVEKPKFPALEALKKNAEILAELEAVITKLSEPAPAAEEDDDNGLGL